MLSRPRLIHAIEIQSRSFRLLQWIGRAIEKGLIPPERAGQHSDTPDAAIAWIGANAHLFPRKLQPNPSELREFACFFWTYVISSFDVIPHPGARMQPGDCGCLCPLCARITNAPYLQPRKLGKADKRRAQQLMCQRVSALADEEGLVVQEAQVQRVVAEEETRRCAAYSAYGQWLFHRLEGQSDGPSVLALWREIAWNRRGSPIPGFKLEYEDFAAAEASLVRVLKDPT